MASYLAFHFFLSLFLLDTDFSKRSCRIALAISGMPFAVLKICDDSPAVCLGNCLAREGCFDASPILGAVSHGDTKVEGK